MSVLTRPPHTVSVQRRKPISSAAGVILSPSGDPVSVPCVVRAVSADEMGVRGTVPVTWYRIVSRTWPGDENSLVTYRGLRLEPQGRPLHYDGSPRTAHWEIQLREAESDAPET